LRIALYAKILQQKQTTTIKKEVLKMYKLYYEKDTILSSGRILRGDIYIQDTTTGAIVNVYNTNTGRVFYCTPYKKVALKWVQGLNKGEYIATRF
jgi:hypothetical protein